MTFYIRDKYQFGGVIVKENSNFYSILIEECNLINKSFKDPIYKFCKSFNIDTIGEFIKVFNDKLSNNELKHYGINYFKGMIELINLEYKNTNFISSDVFFIKITLKKSDNFCSFVCYDGESVTYPNIPLRKLGFTGYEVNALINYVYFIKKTINVIDLLMLFFNDFDKFKFSNDDERKIFHKKLELLINYYLNNKNILLKSNDESDIKFKYLLDRYKKLYIRREKIDKDMKEILNILSTMGINTDEVKSLKKLNNNIAK